MATISKTGIQDGLTSKAEHITRIIDALDGTAVTEVVATGSFTGSFTGDGSSLTGVASTSQINLHFNTQTTISSVSPSSNYYFGNDSVAVTNSSSVNAQVVPYDGQVTSIAVRNFITSPASDPHLAPIQFYNFTTGVSSSLAASLPHTARVNSVIRSGSAFPVSAGDRVMIKVETPAFGSNPTNVAYFADVLIEKT